MSGRPIIPKTALITGAASGLGRALAEKLLGNGATILAIDIDSEGLQSLQDKFEDKCQLLKCDLANIDEIPGVLDAIYAHAKIFGTFQLAILNAGISATGRFENIPVKTHEKLLSLNTISPMIMASGLAKENVMAPSSAIVFVSSLSHKTGYPGAVSYAASKDAIAIYAKSITKEFARAKIHIMTSFPGPIRTQHAARHAPPGAKEKNRMPAEKLALSILKAVVAGKNQHYPDMAAKLAALAGTLFPQAMTHMMRRIIFEKLKRDVY